MYGLPPLSAARMHKNHKHAVPGVRTIEDFKRFVPAFRHAFPDIHITIQDVIAEGDRVVLRYTFRSTNMGDFVTPMPLPATGKQVTVTGMSIGRVASGIQCPLRSRWARPTPCDG